MWDDDAIQEEDVDLLSFCYFFLGTLIPSFWGYLFISYSLDQTYYNNNQESCELLIDWSLVTGVIFLSHAFFYLIMTLASCYHGNREVDPKFQKLVNFESNFWRSFILTFSLLGLFGFFGVINHQFEQQFLQCGELYKLGQMFYYIFFSILASFAIMGCMIQCSLESRILDDDEQNVINQSQREERRRRRQERERRREQRLLQQQQQDEAQLLLQEQQLQQLLQQQQQQQLQQQQQQQQQQLIQAEQVHHGDEEERQPLL